MPNLNRTNSTDNGGIISLLLFAVVVILLLSLTAYFRNDAKYLLGCTNPTNGELHMYQSKRKPMVRDGVIYLDDMVFLTPYPGGPCRIVTEPEFEKIKQTTLDEVV